MPWTKPTQAQLQVRAELAEIAASGDADYEYDVNEPPPHEKERILREIEELHAHRRQFYKAGGRGRGDKNSMRERTKFGSFRKPCSQ